MNRLLLLLLTSIISLLYISGCSCSKIPDTNNVIKCYRDDDGTIRACNSGAMLVDYNDMCSKVDNARPNHYYLTLSFTNHENKVITFEQDVTHPNFELKEIYQVQYNIDNSKIEYCYACEKPKPCDEQDLLEVYLIDGSKIYIKSKTIVIKPIQVSKQELTRENKYLKELMLKDLDDL